MNYILENGSQEYDSLDRYLDTVVHDALILDSVNIEGHAVSYGSMGQEFVDRVQNLLREHGLDKIIIDVALEVRSIDDDALLELKDLLSSLAPVYVLSSEKSVWEKRRPQRFWSTRSNDRWHAPFFEIFRRRYCDDVERFQIFDRSDACMSVNMNINPLRYLWYHQLHDRGIVDRVKYSQHIVDVPDTMLEFLTPEARQRFLPLREMQEVLIADDDLHRYEWLTSQLWTKAAVNISCEINAASAKKNFISAISEKSVKPLVACQLPVILGGAGVNTYLEALGFDMFSDIVPWNTWDHIEDLTFKMDLFSDWFEQWIKSEDLVALHTSLRSRILDNQRNLMSDQFGDLLLRDIGDL